MAPHILDALVPRLNNNDEYRQPPRSNFNDDGVYHKVSTGATVAIVRSPATGSQLIYSLTLLGHYNKLPKLHD